MNQEYINETKKKIESLRDLEKNWDGYGSPPIPECVIVGLLKFADDVLPLVDGLSYAYVVPGGGGHAEGEGSGAQFEWHVQGKDLSLEIELEEGHTVHYLKWDPEDDTKEEDLFEITDDNGIGRCIDLLMWFSMKNK